MQEDDRDAPAPVGSGPGRSRVAARRAAAWSLLLLLSIATTWGLRTLHVPAALMLGPMIPAIVLALRHGQLKLRRPVAVAAQALLGCRLGMAISPDLLRAALGYLPILTGMTVVIMLATAALAVVTTRRGWFPGSTAVWGLSPGGAAPMVMMAELYGSDPRIVAVMQYLRVVAAALAAILVGTVFGSPDGHNHMLSSTGSDAIWFPPIHGVAFTETLALAALGALAAWASGRSVAVLFVPMLGGAALQISGIGKLELPAFLMAAAFAVIGWNIGLKFTRASLAASLQLMPRIVASIVVMLAICGLLSQLLARLLGVDALSAYLALSPGGLDSVIIIAASTKVDLPLVLSAQVVRLLVVLLLAPPLARFVVQRGIHESEAPPPGRLAR